MIGVYRSVTTTFYNANGTIGTTLTRDFANNELFIVKYDPSGTVQWATKSTGAGFDSYSSSIGIDGSDNVYVCGFFSSTLTVRNADTTVALTLTPATTGLNESFIVRYTSTGNASLIGRMQGSVEYAVITVNSTGTVYVLGQFLGETLNLLNSDNVTVFKTFTIGIPGDLNAFVAVYNSAGVGQWAANLTSTTTTASGITIDASGNIYITGTYVDNVSINNSNGDRAFVLSQASIGETESYIVKYNSSGFAQWRTKISSSTFSSAITSDSVGNLYIIGSSSGVPLLFNSNGISSGITFSTNFISTAFLAKYNTSGTAQFALAIGVGSGAGSNGGDVSINNAGEICISGQYGTSTLRFYDTSGNILASPSLALIGSTDIFLAKYNSLGVLQWATRAGGTGNDSGFRNTRISIDSSDSIIMVGGYQTQPITLYSVGF